MSKSVMKYSFETTPDTYKHWKLSFDGEIATLCMDIQENEGFGDYVLKMNSYDLSVDIELADAVQRIRFEHPEVKTVLLTSAKDRIFCAGANIPMLGGSSHAFKVNFCKFTNETRLYIEDASENSGLKFMAACEGAASGGGYELALACDEILLVDDASSAVSFPEVPLLAVLPGTGGLTRITDKRMVRRDLCDVFSTVAEGIKGKKAKQYKLVDHLAPRSKFAEKTQSLASELAKKSTRSGGTAVILPALELKEDGDHLDYTFVSVSIDKQSRTAELLIKAPKETPSTTTESIEAKGAELWALKCFRELDDAILRLRMNHLDIGFVTVKTSGSADKLLAAESALLTAVKEGSQFANEVLQHMKRVLKRLDVTAKTFCALVEPSSCYAGVFAEFLWIADRSYILDDMDSDEPSRILVTEISDGLLPMGNGLTRLQTRFYGDEESVNKVLSSAKEARIIEAEEAEEMGIVTFCRDDIDYPDEVRLFIEERTAMSPDALTGMEANLRWPGPETMETRIFGRLSAWQNWIFTRPNSTGEKGALTLYGAPEQPEFNMTRC